ncbi:Carboxyvinyl-carboxyphosphonate phosphorylmutase [Candidatus Nitrosocosmicus oleophilus]|uniref:Carboxyvinyl-carboxyphosphonate phosphorylmutase n=1 Tax=Candidatus Nitrosocosmicus oleophilus TaxID=1353260 RepID=A0A654M0K7_9ARCH|nr:isocitrate lyase/PEP mutase family protein [Candidatus Nitrosocosmicus oleophilus]ALI36071.1 Carboxyvinyl-carboxyphosphonate phosphorylmutase [Candidatus Nitrosocosmicus oleophilus]
MSLSKLLSRQNDILVMPGVYDALTAKIAEQVGFEAIFQTGYGTSASLLALPDFGFLSITETVENARRITRAVDIPLIVDVDTGYGNPLTVSKLVNDLQRIGASGIFLEDQVWPKRCGHMMGKEVIDSQEYIQKLRSAIDAKKQNSDFIIVARTDAMAPLGIEEAIKRGKLYREIGADVVFVEAPRSLEDMKKIADQIDGPLVANMIEEGMTPNLTSAELLELGYKIALFPLSGLYSSAFAIFETFKTLKETGTTKTLKDKMMKFKEFNKLVSLDKYMTMENKYV